MVQDGAPGNVVINPLVDGEGPEMNGGNISKILQILSLLTIFMMVVLFIVIYDKKVGFFSYLKL